MDPRENQEQEQEQEQELRLQHRDWLMDPETQEVRIEHESGGDENPEDDDRGGGHGGVGRSSGYGVVVVEREHMFDKVVTPSDVGKLNRLVIPKQHAEKYFPLDSSHHNNNNNNNNNNIIINNNNSCSNNTNINNNSNSENNNNNNSSNNKAGLLLNFEDRTGKSWRFRYSYWNSSQSYVMTKGWSRFVKEKQLSAGDIVSFQRAVGDDIQSKNTFFIDWRRRPPDHHQYHHHHHHHLGTAFSVHHSIPGWMRGSGSSSSSIIPSPITNPTLFLRSHPHESHPLHHHSNNNNAINWDHSSYNSSSSNNNNNVTHLSMVPYAYGGSGTTSVVNPSAGSSLILLRSSAPNPSAINQNPHLVPNYPHYHQLNPSSSTTPSNSLYQGVSTATRLLLEPPNNKVYDSVPIVHGKAASSSSASSAPSPHGSGAGKRSLRLFGVNMEYDQHHHHPHRPQFDDSMDPSTSNFNAPQN